jgi:beta-galactosidase/beta-glucuronidase
MTDAVDVPRNEYPRPQLRRDRWLCLNGIWEFETDPGDSGRERGLLDRPLAGRITVPFCMESPLSGVEVTDFVAAVWYRRTVTVPAAWTGQRVLLLFQAVDEEATVFVDRREVGRHRGGFTPFTCDITDVAVPGSDVTVVVRARDDHRVGKPKGKQSSTPDYAGCYYTRTTGIWQTVWLEPVPQTWLDRPRITPSLGRGAFVVETPVRGQRAGMRVRVTVTDDRGDVAVAEVDAGADQCPSLDLVLPPDRLRMWSIDDPFCYDVRLSLIDSHGAEVDAVSSYAGLRSVAVDGQRVLLNGQPVFQRLVLDQGYYPDGVLTAPTDAALLDDIRLAKAAGFNGARLHQKVFEERYLFHADREGFLVWGEMPDWGVATDGPDGDRMRHSMSLLTQWLEALARDHNHPSIVGWCGLNETLQSRTDRTQVLDDVTRACFLAALAADRSRPVLDASGYAHRVAETHVWDSHDYEQDVETFTAHHRDTVLGEPFVNRWPGAEVSVAYAGQPVFVSEFGGIWWRGDRVPGADSWGYGTAPIDEEELHVRFAGLCGALLDNPGIFGYCYTQLTDVHQEQNGVYTFDRRPKFDLDRIRTVQQRPAAIEVQPVAVRSTAFAARRTASRT